MYIYIYMYIHIYMRNAPRIEYTGVDIKVMRQTLQILCHPYN